MSSVKEGLETVKQQILNACETCGRDRSSLTLVCVSKTKPSEMIVEAYEAGERNFGENYVQELVAKEAELPKDIIWHMIGPLQKNKVKKAVSAASLIHSVDSIELAQCIDKEAAKLSKVQDILIEINMANEDTKHGITEESVISVMQELSKLEHIRVKGLMCIPPRAEEDFNRSYFRKLREIKDKINDLKIPGISLSELSMGMTDDFAVAIEEGATFIRIGTAIFGARNYNK